MPELERPACIVEADKKELGTRFMGLPERWMDSPLWRCSAGHVSRWYIKSERLGRSACPACLAPVWLTFPEDKDDQALDVVKSASTLTPV